MGFFLDLFDEGQARSPIEEKLGLALLANIQRLNTPYILTEKHFGQSLFETQWGLFHQIPVGPYRADFVVKYSGGGPTILVAVECDGHDFHERTSEQARHDRRRDRYFQTHNYLIARFTGSEIWANAARCADEVVTMADKASEQYWVTRGTLEHEATKNG